MLIFQNNMFFWAKNSGNMPVKLVFGLFLKISSLLFPDFCTKMRISNAQNMVESNCLENFFSGRKCREYAGLMLKYSGFSPLLLIFIGLFPKTLLITMPTNKAWRRAERYGGQKNWRRVHRLWKKCVDAANRAQFGI